MAVTQVTKETFDTEIVGATMPVLAVFSAPWCVYCRRIGPVLDRMADQLSGRVSLVKIDIDEQPELTDRYGVETIPALLLFQSGTPGEALIAPSSQAQIESWMNGQLS